MGNDGRPGEETTFLRCRTNQHTPRHGNVVNTGEKLIAIELTVPWEERCDEVCRRKSWTTWLYQEDIGCRWFPATSMWKAFTTLSKSICDRRKPIQAASNGAENTSSWIWLILECPGCKVAKHSMMYGTNLRMLIG